MNSFDKYVNETQMMLFEKSINKIQKEFQEVVTKMAELAQTYASTQGDEKAEILQTLKELTVDKRRLAAELDAKVAGKDRNVQLAITEKTYNKKSLMKAMKADDGMIQLANGEEYVIYAYDNGNDENDDMWGDKTIFGLDQDGEEHEIEYSDIVRYNESLITERHVTLKRRYTENHPAVKVGKGAKIRNKVLEAIKDGKITQEQFDSIVSELSNNSKRWSKNNSKYFTIAEDGISLSKFGKKILAGITVNEKTEKNPGIWVPGGFDKDISKVKNSKITRDLVAKTAKKHEVDLDDAIKYVEFGWAIDLNENKTMKTQFIYESFGDFVNSLNESVINEAFASTKLASILTGGNKMSKDLPKAFYNMAKIALDKVQDVDIIEIDPQAARKEKRQNAVYLYFTTNEKENPYAARGSYGVSTIPANTLLAITDGSNEWMNMQWQNKYNSKDRKKSLQKTKRDDSSGFDKSSSNDSYGSGISSLTKVAELADRAYCLDLDILRARYSTTQKRNDRTEAKAGAIAFKDDKDFKKANLDRYNMIIADRASKMPIDKMVKDAIDTLTEQIKSALVKGEKGRYGDIIVGKNKKGREGKLSDAASHMQNILNDFQRYVSATNQAEIEKNAGYGGDYYDRDVKRNAKEITDKIKQIETFSYVW
jgi:hypothetical protein|tara:strand:- start:167 stop:2122 length:1956 start_codon:yes stop_codon:yes gene_type:complete